MSWTRERVDLLKRYWAEGKSASHVALLLGGFEHCADGGRNAVIGKVRRLRLAGERRTVDRGRTEDGRSLSSVLCRPSPGLRAPSPVPRVSPSARPGAGCPPEPVSLDVPLTELRPGQCKWPHGDGPFLFCGHPSVRGGVYCTFHKGIAYRAAERQARPFVILGLRRVAA